jgi:hypothetical protein
VSKEYYVIKSWSGALAAGFFECPDEAEDYIQEIVQSLRDEGKYVEYSDYYVELVR